MRLILTIMMFAFSLQCLAIENPELQNIKSKLLQEDIKSKLDGLWMLNGFAAKTEQTPDITKEERQLLDRIVIDYLSSDNLDLIIATATTIKNLNYFPNGSVELLRKRLNDKSPQSRNAGVVAANVLGKMAVDLLPDILKLAQNDTDLAVRSKAIITIVRLDPNNPGVENTLRRLVSIEVSGDEKQKKFSQAVKDLAIQTLAELNSISTKSQQEFEQKLLSGDSALMKEALDISKRTFTKDDAPLVPALINALFMKKKTNSAELLEWDIKSVLASIGTAEAQEAVKKWQSAQESKTFARFMYLLKNPENCTAEMLAKGLAEFCERKIMLTVYAVVSEKLPPDMANAIPDLMKMLDDRDFELADLAASLLVKINTPQTFKAGKEFYDKRKLPDDIKKLDIDKASQMLTPKVEHKYKHYFFSQYTDVRKQALCSTIKGKIMDEICSVVKKEEPAKPMLDSIKALLGFYTLVDANGKKVPDIAIQDMPLPINLRLTPAGLDYIGNTCYNARYTISRDSSTENLKQTLAAKLDGSIADIAKLEVKKENQDTCAVYYVADNKYLIQMDQNKLYIYKRY